MYFEGKIKLRSYKASYCLIEVVTKTGMKFSMTARQDKKRQHLNIGDSLRGDHMGKFESTIKPVLVTTSNKLQSNLSYGHIRQVVA
jgi:hypothetical protein